VNLTEFLLARIAEDEEWARSVAPPGWEVARTRAECDSKRRLVEFFDAMTSSPYHREIGRITLRTLSLPYADHPDYRPEWKP
jgi:hypothetical protein